MMGFGRAVDTLQVTIIGPEVAVVTDTAEHHCIRQERHSGNLGRVLDHGRAVLIEGDATDDVW